MATHREKLGLPPTHTRLPLGPYDAGDIIVAGTPFEICENGAAEIAGRAKEKHSECHYGKPEDGMCEKVEVKTF